MHRNGWWGGFKIDALHALAEIVAAADQVVEVLASHFCLGPDLGRLFSLALQLLDVSLQANADIISRALECAANLGADAESIRVRVVDSCKLGGQLGVQSMGKRFRDRCQNV